MAKKSEKTKDEEPRPGRMDQTLLNLSLVGVDMSPKLIREAQGLANKWFDEVMAPFIKERTGVQLRKGGV